MSAATAIRRWWLALSVFYLSLWLHFAIYRFVQGQCTSASCTVLAVSQVMLGIAVFAITLTLGQTQATRILRAASRLPPAIYQTLVIVVHLISRDTSWLLSALLANLVAQAFAVTLVYKKFAGRLPPSGGVGVAPDARQFLLERLHHALPALFCLGAFRTAALAQRQRSASISARLARCPVRSGASAARLQQHSLHGYADPLAG